MVTDGGCTVNAGGWTVTAGGIGASTVNRGVGAGGADGAFVTTTGEVNSTPSTVKLRVSE